MTNRFLEKHTRAVIGRLLDEALVRAGRSSRPAPVAPQIVDVPRVCAVHDKPYIVTFERAPDGLWRFTKTMKAKGGVIGVLSKAVKAQTIDASDIDLLSAPECCAWCYAPGSTRAGKRWSAIMCQCCGAFICLGRTEGEFFRCRDSCGASGEVGDWVPLQGMARKDAHPRSISGGVTSTTQQDPALGCKETLRLPVGASITRKGGK